MTIKMTIKNPDKNPFEATQKKLENLSSDELIFIIYVILTSMNSNIDEFFQAVKDYKAERKAGNQ